MLRLIKFGLLISASLLFSNCQNRQAQVAPGTELDNTFGGGGTVTAKEITIEFEASVTGANDFKNDALTIESGESVTLRWEITGDPDSCTILNLVFDALSQDVKQATPTSNTTYSLQCQRGDELFEKSIAITVTEPPLPALVATLEGRQNGVGSYQSNQITIDYNQSPQLKWTVSGTATSCAIRVVAPLGLPDAVADARGGGIQAFGALTESRAYKLVCERGSESKESLLIVNVNPQPPLGNPLLEARPAGSGSYRSDSITVLDTQSIDFKWTVSTGNPTACSISGVVADAKATASKRIGSITSSKTYTIICQRGAETQSDSVQVNVVTLPPLQQGLVASYTFDGAIGEDASYYQNDAVNDLVTSSSDAIKGKSGFFSATNGNSMVANNMNMGTFSGFTVSAWVKLEKKTEGSHLHRILYGSGGGMYFVLHFYDNSQHFLCSLKKDGVIDATVRAPEWIPYSMGEWHHVACVFGSQPKIIIDGHEARALQPATVDYSKLGHSGTYKLTIGRNPTSDAYLTKGHVDEINIWNRALNASELNQIYQSPNSLP